MLTRLLILLVKNPVPGRVKTRIARDAGDLEAVRIYHYLVNRVIAQLNDLEATGVNLHILFDPPEALKSVKAWLAPALANADILCAQFIPQSLGDLGHRLSGAFATGFEEGYDEIAVIGSDCIGISHEILEQTWKGLDTHDAVIGPTNDGGYYLLALKKHAPTLFHEIPWSTETTFQATMDSATKEALSVATLPTLSDVDTLADWEKADVL